MSKDQIKAIKELEGYQFFVPSYQRGYRWGEREVRALLHDIYDFQNKSQDENQKEEFYCLQPLAVKKRDEKTYILIDGQQRLTTIFLIVKFIQNKDFFEIKYETREKSFEFLKGIKDGFSSNKKQRNMDFYHFLKAYEYIENFFKDRAKERELFLETLLEKCKVLWYEIYENEKENDVFIRLNIGKIPLVEAENIKALFLSKNDTLDQGELEDRAEFWYETEIKARENKDFRYCVLSKIDERDIMEEEQEKPVIKDDILRIESYLRAITSKKDLFDFFYESYQAGKLNDRWNELEEAINTLSGFSSAQGQEKIDREIFHYLGFLIFNGEKLSEIYKKWSDVQDKEEFSALLFLETQKKVSKYLKNIEELNYTESKDHEALKSLLLLFNLEYLIKQESSNEYFKFNRFVLEKWSLEHIYAQNSKSISQSKEDNKKIEWLKEVLEYIEEEELKGEIKKILKKMGTNKKVEDVELNKLYAGIDENFKRANDLHKISNLTLLDRSSNSRIGNQIFSKKRKEIRDLKERDKLIPITTEKVFDKVFSKKKDNPDVFTREDQKDYLEEIQKHLERYKDEGKDK